MPGISYRMRLELSLPVLEQRTIPCIYDGVLADAPLIAGMAKMELAILVGLLGCFVCADRVVHSDTQHHDDYYEDERERKHQLNLIPVGTEQRSALRGLAFLLHACVHACSPYAFHLSVLLYQARLIVGVLVPFLDYRLAECFSFLRVGT